MPFDRVGKWKEKGLPEELGYREREKNDDT